MNKEETTIQKPKINPDQPLKSITEDKLGRSDLAKNIAEKIIEYKEKEPLIIGLYGSWGYGKTTVLNFIKEHINKFKQDVNEEDKQHFPDVVQFDPWIFANQEELIRRFLETILFKIKNIDEKKYKNLIRLINIWITRIKVARSIFSKKLVHIIIICFLLLGTIPNINSLMPFTIKPKLWLFFILFAFVISWAQDIITSIVGNLLNRIKGGENLIGLRNNLEKELRKLKNKLIIIIDEIDRLNIEEIKIVFQLVKATFNLQNLIFILAFDKEKISEALSIRTSDGKDIFDGKEYIDKIVQLPISIPTPDKTLMWKFFNEHVNSSIEFIAQDKRDNNWWRDIYDSGLGSILLKEGNPRKIIRNFNNINAHLFAIQHEVNPVDFIAISTIQLYYPELYEYIAKRRTIFTPPSIYDLGDQLNLQNKKEDVKKELELELSKYDKSLSNLIHKLFPILDVYLTNTSFDEEYFRQWVVDKRVCSPEYFDRYFYLKIPEGDKSHLIIEEFLNHKGSVDELKNLLNEQLKSDYLPRFLFLVCNHSNDMTLDNTNNKLIAICDISENFPEEYDYSIYYPYSNITNIIHALIRRHGKPMGPDILVKVIKETKSVYIPIRIIDYLEYEKNEHRLNQTIFDESNLIHLKSSYVRKIEKLFDENTLINVKKLNFALDRWKKWSEKINKLETFIDQITQKEDLLLKLLPHFVDSRTRNGKIEYHFDFETLSGLGVDIQRAYTNVTYIRSTKISILTKNELRAIWLYEKDYNFFTINKKNSDKCYRDSEIF